MTNFNPSVSEVIATCESQGYISVATTMKQLQNIENRLLDMDIKLANIQFLLKGMIR